MTKKKVDEGGRAGGVAPFFEASLLESRKRFGSDRVLVGTQEDESQFGIEMPSFAQQYLFHSNIMPMGKIIGMAAPAKTCKSATLFDMFGMFIRAGGYAKLVETENKLNMHFLNSVVGHDDALRCRYSVDAVDSVQETQDAVTLALETYKDKCPDNDVPYIIGVDSLMGNAPEEIKDGIVEEGHASKQYPVAAQLWSNYFKKLCSDLIGKPIVVAFTNHLKERIQEGFGRRGGPPAKTTAGGVSQDFHAAQTLYSSKISDIEQAQREGKLIKLKSQKCGLGPDNREVEVPVLWWWEGDDRDRRQITVLDWHAATARLLVDKGLEPRIREVSDVRVDSNRYWSKRLGLEKVSDTEMGRAVFESAEYMADLRKATGYRLWRVFGGAKA